MSSRQHPQPQPPSRERRMVSMTATAAKNHFSRVVNTVVRGGRIVVTKHGEPIAVVLSVEDFETLINPQESKLDALSGEFDALLARMQRVKMRAAMDAAFAATPVELGEAAVEAARGRG